MTTVAAIKNDWQPTRRGRMLFISFAVWTLFGLITVSQNYSFYIFENRVPPQLSRLLAREMPGAYFWFLLTPVVFELGRRFRLGRQHWLHSLLIHVGFSLATGFGYIFALTLARYYFRANTSNPTSFRIYLLGNFSGSFQTGLLVYSAILGISYALEFYRKFREREVAAAQLSKQLVQAELQALRMQLQPHFLFNTLHSIAALVRKGENNAAVQMLTGLGDLLRYTLGQAEQQLVPLHQELEFVGQYLELEQIRFQDRLKIKIEATPETLNASTPNLLLQPLVENAIRHGIAERAAAGLIEISAWRVQEKLFLQIRDDGPGLGSKTKPSIGLANTQARLRQLYGEAFSFELTNVGEFGATAKLSIPYQTAFDSIASEQANGANPSANSR